MKINPVAISLLFFSSALQGLPVGNPALPRILEEGFFTTSAGWINARAGYEGNFVTDRRLKQKTGSSNHIDSMEMDSQAAIFSLNLRNRWDLFCTLGEARYKTHWQIEEDTGLARISADTRYGCGWSVGTKIVFFEWGDVSLSAGGRFFAARAKLASLTKNGESFSTENIRLKQREWQLDLGLSYQIDFLIPYIEGFYSRPKYFIGTFSEEPSIASDGSYAMEMRSRERFGLAVGCGLSCGKIFFLNFEARLFNEEACTVSGEIRF